MRWEAGSGARLAHAVVLQVVRVPVFVLSVWAFATFLSWLSEAMGMAVRIARAHTRRDVVLFSGYHGWNDWYLAANLGEAELARFKPQGRAQLPHSSAPTKPAPKPPSPPPRTPPPAARARA